MTLVHGFSLVRDETIDEINTRAKIWHHEKSGANLLSLENDDENKVFGIAFRTPPEDSTGVPHIMEHAVLAGSRKYRVKEPFIELIKGSLKTYLNASTFADKTIYPVASTNLQDFYNLIDVYLDGVFFPLNTRHHLDQEGWHFELDNLDDPLTYKGVVFNEMKGAFSSPDSVLYRYSFQSLFPDTPYGHESGGDPEAIPDLTYEQFIEFHNAYYHPANSYIFFYGDDDPEERLRLLDGYLSEFDEVEIDSQLPLQAPFEVAKHFTVPYTVEADSGNGKEPKAMVQLNWVFPEFENPTLVMALSILSYVLVSTQASPLRKILIDSGFGEDVTGGGLSTSTRQMTFSVGLKGVTYQDVSQVEPLILQSLQELAEVGFDSELIEAAINTVEFSLRENNTGPYPRGLALFVGVLETWLYDRDPLLPLRYEEPLRIVKQMLEQDPSYLQALLSEHLLENNHRSTIVLEPDPALAEKNEAAERARLTALREEMSEQDLQAIIDNTRELHRLQATPDSPEALAALPMLTLADLDREIKTIPIDITEVAGSRVLTHDLFTNGIAYVDVGFDMRMLPQELLLFSGLFGSLLLSMGTEKEDYVKISQKIGRKTGGIGSSTFTSEIRSTNDQAAWMFLSGKATIDKTQDLFEILSDLLLNANLDNRERFKQLLLRAKARSESSLIPAGHAVVNSRLRAHFTGSNWVAEQIGGLDQLFFLRNLEQLVDRDWPAVLEQLEATRQAIINRNGMVVNITLDDENRASLETQLAQFVKSIPARTAEPQTWAPDSLPINEGLTIPARVNYVGKGANIYELGYELDGSISVILNLLRTTWLWEKIRIQGGAYGAFNSFNQETGVLTFLSYRDPNFAETLEAYDQAADFLRNLELSNAELTKNIIGAIGALDSYQLPDAKGFTSMVRYLIGRDDDQRQTYRDQVLGTTIEDFHAFADVLDRVKEEGQIVVLGAAETLSQANEPEPWLDIRAIS